VFCQRQRLARLEDAVFVHGFDAKGPRNNNLVNLVLPQLLDCAMTAACKMHLL
jgi:hypothetical protein